MIICFCVRERHLIACKRHSCKGAIATAISRRFSRKNWCAVFRAKYFGHGMYSGWDLPAPSHEGHDLKFECAAPTLGRTNWQMQQSWTPIRGILTDMEVKKTIWVFTEGRVNVFARIKSIIFISVVQKGFIRCSVFDCFFRAYAGHE